MEPSHRIWMSEMSQYMPAIGLNTVVRGFTIGTVVMTSDESKLAVGSKVCPVSVLSPWHCRSTAKHMLRAWRCGTFVNHVKSMHFVTLRRIAARTG
jgi:NADPH-dependent curcumin reductase CurA